MDSLTTSYLVGMLIGSASAVGAAFLGNKVSPIESSSAVTSPPAVESSVAAPSLQNTEQSSPAVSSATQ